MPSASPRDSYQLQLFVHVLYDKLDGNLVVAATWYDNIGMYHRWCYVIAIRRLHHTRILFDDTLNVATSHRNISAIDENNDDVNFALRYRILSDNYLFKRLAKRTSASVSTKTFISSIFNTSWL